jgi:hypothetical protein
MKNCIRNYFRDGSEWIYLRRYDTELSEIRKGGTFFSALERNDEFPGFEFQTMGDVMQVRMFTPEGEKKKKWRNMGFMMALSKSQSYKSINLARVRTIIFDEFIKERNVPPYLRDEPDILMNLWETVDRREDRVKIVMLANAADIVNPYFTRWNVQLPSKGKTRTYKHRASSITIQYADDGVYKDYASQTSIGLFTQGTSYESYALENSFQTNTTMIADKTEKALFRYAFVIRGKTYGIWLDWTTGDYYVNRKTINNEFLTFALIREDMRPNMQQLERSSPIMRNIKRALLDGYMYFDSIETKENFSLALQLLGIK